MRRNIELRYKVGKPEGFKKSKTISIFLYTHWNGTGLEKTLAKALDRARDRWSDPIYLARTIFTDMIGDDKSTTGFGISPFEMDQNLPTLVVDLEKQMVNSFLYEMFIHNYK